MEVRLGREQKIEIRDADDVYKIMRQVLRRENRFGRGKEHFWVIGLSDDHKILYIELVSLGSRNRAAVEPDEVFQLAVHKNAIRLILVHNHPSGTLTPSEQDKDLTNHLIHAGEIIRKQVIDHIVISEDDYFSFALNGLMAELQMSKKYKLGYIEAEKIREQGAAIGEERGRYLGAKEQAIGIAMIMKADGKPAAEIAKYTSLSEQEIEKL